MRFIGFEIQFYYRLTLILTNGGLIKFSILDPFNLVKRF